MRACALRSSGCAVNYEPNKRRSAALELLLRQRTETIDALRGTIDKLREQNKRLDQEAEHLAQMVAAPLVNADEIVE